MCLGCSEEASNGFYTARCWHSLHVQKQPSYKTENSRSFKGSMAQGQKNTWSHSFGSNPRYPSVVHNQNHHKTTNKPQKKGTQTLENIRFWPTTTWQTHMAYLRMVSAFYQRMSIRLRSHRSSVRGRILKSQSIMPKKKQPMHIKKTRPQRPQLS